MAQRRKTMIKAENVRIEGSVELPAGYGGAKSLSTTPRKGGEPAAKIVEQNDGRTIIEIVCACGQKMRLNCVHDT